MHVYEAVWLCSNIMHTCAVECKIKLTYCNYDNCVITVCNLSVIYLCKNENASDL